MSLNTGIYHKGIIVIDRKNQFIDILGIFYLLI